MQTFPQFPASAQVLDRQRLGKQRVEAKQILQCLLGEGSTSWASHPAVRMWNGAERALAAYDAAVCREWLGRGYRDTLLPFFLARLARRELGSVRLPWWVGEERFHSAHRASLLAKSPEWYSRFNWSESPEIAYWWPQ